jgi:hypothetical protein
MYRNTTVTTFQKLESCLRRLEQRNATRLDEEPFFIGEGETFSMEGLKNLMTARILELRSSMSTNGIDNTVILQISPSGRDLQGVYRVNNAHSFHILYYPPTQKYLYYSRDKSGGNNNQYQIFNNTTEAVNKIREEWFTTTPLTADVATMWNYIIPLVN